MEYKNLQEECHEKERKAKEQQIEVERVKKEMRIKRQTISSYDLLLKGAKKGHHKKCEENTGFSCNVCQNRFFDTAESLHNHISRRHPKYNTIRSIEEIEDNTPKKENVQQNKETTENNMKAQITEVVKSEMQKLDDWVNTWDRKIREVVSEQRKSIGEEKDKTVELSMTREKLLKIEEERKNKENEEKKTRELMKTQTERKKQQMGFSVMDIANTHFGMGNAQRPYTTGNKSPEEIKNTGIVEPIPIRREVDTRRDYDNLPVISLEKQARKQSEDIQTTREEPKLAVDIQTQSENIAPAPPSPIVPISMQTVEGSRILSSSIPIIQQDSSHFISPPAGRSIRKAEVSKVNIYLLL